MKKFLLSAAAALVVLTGAAPAADARIGTDIGISFPTGGGGGAARKETRSYASFTAGRMIQELSATKKNGRLMIEFTVSNEGDEPISVEHSDGQEYDFVILDKRGNSLWRWSEGREFRQERTSSVIGAHGVQKYTVEMERKDFKKIKDDAVLVTAFLKDTPYTLSATVPEAARDAGGGAIRGAIHIGNGGWYDPW